MEGCKDERDGPRERGMEGREASSRRRLPARACRAGFTAGETAGVSAAGGAEPTSSGDRVKSWGAGDPYAVAHTRAANYPK